MGNIFSQSLRSFSLKLKDQPMPGLFLFETFPHVDSRGYFAEAYKYEVLTEAVGHQINFVQENESRSTFGVLRGLHFQSKPFSQSKLVRILEGEVLDVAVDLRVGSETFGEYFSAILSKENNLQMFIPRGFAHGFVVLSDHATFSYKVDAKYSPESERGIKYDDPSLNVDWVLNSDDLILSDKDLCQPSFKEEPAYFYIGDNLYED